MNFEIKNILATSLTIPGGLGLGIGSWVEGPYSSNSTGDDFLKVGRI